MYLGIDPGKSGGMVLLSKDRKVEVVAKMPNSEKDIWDWFYKLTSEERGIYPDMCYIEKVHAMPKQGVSSSFTFGMGYGGLRMALIASSIPFQEVTPRTWQKELGTKARGKKESQPAFKGRLRSKAQQLFPRLDVWEETKGYQMAVCDALLIAEFCRRKEVGNE